MLTVCSLTDLVSGNVRFTKATSPGRSVRNILPSKPSIVALTEPSDLSVELIAMLYEVGVVWETMMPSTVSSASSSFFCAIFGTATKMLSFALEHGKSHRLGENVETYMRRTTRRIPATLPIK